jgi:pyruvate/2-oxoglutarate dehydrogenase complex dihydrolipoamide dehydrogenase (E3) component
MDAERFDAVILGSGQAGKPLTLALAKAGWKVALVEREHVGGTCINVGCTPTKTMIASARVAHLARRGADYGVNIGTAGGDVTVDLARVVARKQQMVERFRNYGQKKLEETAGVTLIFGKARFLDATTVAVQLNGGGGTRRITAPKIVINTGGRPALPPIPGLNEVPTLDSTSVMELRAVPRHLLVLGGGYIGLEFGQMFRRFGAQVTVLQREAQLVPREDEDVAARLRGILEEDGIHVETDIAIERFSRSGKDIGVTFKRRGQLHAVEGSHLLVAVGRNPNTEDLDLAAAGVATTKSGHVQVDATLATNVAGIFAVGDVKGGPEFTHISYDDFRVLRDRWIGNADASIEGRLVPYTMFTDPQLASVGLNESAARKAGKDIRVAKIEMSGIARALETDETRGLFKVIVDARSGQILGCTVLGIEGGEIMSMIQIAMMGKLPYTALKEAVFAHPTLAEGLNNIVLALDG